MRLLAVKRLVSDTQAEDRSVEEFLIAKTNLARERL